MWTLFVVAGLLTAQPQQSGAAAGTVRPEVPAVQERAMAMIGNRPDPLELTLAAPVQLPNGRRLGASVRPAASAEPWWVYSRGNLCQSVISHGPAPTDATEGWKITVTERSRPTPAQVVVGVTWSRMWERGRAIASGSGGTSELTLQRADRIALDTITRVADPVACPGTMKSLELQVGAPFSPPAPAGDSPLDGIVDVELWMVHQAPNGTEAVEHQIVRLMNGVIGFAFKGGPIDTSDGVVAIELSGQLKAVRREDGSRGLWASLTRGVTRQASGVTVPSGVTTTTVGWPTTSDVVSLELPPLQFSAGSGTRTAAGGGGRGGATGSTRAGGGGGGGTVPPGGQATGGGAAAGGIARGTGGGGVVTGGGRVVLPNLLEGHRLSLRVRLIESQK